jgi:cytochrome c6
MEASFMRSMVAGIIVLFVFGCSLSAQTFDAAQQFKQKCAMCHGADGKTPSIIGRNLGSPDLSSDKVQKMSDKDLHEIISHGKDKMPAYEKAFGEKNIDAMVKYVRAIKK